MSDKEKLDKICKDIRNHNLIITEEEQKRIDYQWFLMSQTSTQKKLMLAKQRSLYATK